MIESDTDEFDNLMIGAGELYAREVTPVLMRIYFKTLQNYSIEEVTIAFNKHVCDPEQGMFFPKPAHLIKILKPAEITIKQKALLAWFTIMHEVERGGTFQNLKEIDTHLLDALKSIGGIRAVGLGPEKELHWKKKAFIEAYELYADAPPALLRPTLEVLRDIV